MKLHLISLVFLGTFACKVTDGVSNQKNQAYALESSASTAGSAATPPTSGEVVSVQKNDKESGILLRWRTGRWSITASGETLDKKGSVACEIKTSDVTKKLGTVKLKALQAAIENTYPLRDNRQTSPIFRGLEQARELVAVWKGEEFLVEKMFQSRDSIIPKGEDKDGKQQAHLELILDVATNPILCPNIPN
ncbi:MAG: hypothetical protein EOP09_17810 [Proteobacteria bacterium]|nr:MAG: hypothetical protein EOP09_17810 [Pseudomonadota bacterium]